MVLNLVSKRHFELLYGNTKASNIWLVHAGYHVSIERRSEKILVGKTHFELKMKNYSLYERQSWSRNNTNVCTI